MTAETYIQIKIFNRNGKVAEIKGNDIPKELNHARRIYYSKINNGGI